VLDAIAAEAGLVPQSSFDTSWAFEYPDEETLGSAMVAPAGIAELVGASREQAVRKEIVKALAPYRTPSGAYRLENEFHFLVASA
jgi:hypothetical protein